METKISIIIPVFNEINTIQAIIEKVRGTELLNKEIIVVDDCSTDGTTELLKNQLHKRVDKIFYHSINQGKGAAIRTAKSNVTGDIIIIQDADLEYDPKDYKKLIEPIQNKEFEVVYGSRVLGKKRYKIESFTSVLRIFFNHVLTILSNLINKQTLTDAHTCYKVFSKKVFDQIELKENTFSFCPEVTTKISNLGFKIKEVPINYKGRSVKEGKKIQFKDGIIAIKTLIVYKFKK